MNTWSFKRRQSIRSFAKVSTGTRTLARVGAKAGLATSPFALGLVIAEASVRTAHVEAGRVFRARARIRATARARMPHCPRRLATTRSLARASTWGKDTRQGRSKGKPRGILEKVYDAAGHELRPDIQKREGWERRFDSRGRTLSLQYCTRVIGDDENDERRIMHWAHPSSDEEEGIAFYRSKVTEPIRR